MKIQKKLIKSQKQKPLMMGSIGQMPGLGW